MGETQSKWQVWVQSPDLNEGVAVSNFNSPVLRPDLKKPEFTVNWTPEKAFYTAKYDNADIITEIFVPSDKATVCMKTTIVNKSDKSMDFTVTPSVFPYVNIPQMVAWDLPEWYLNTKVYKMDDRLTIHGQMNDPLRKANGDRSVTFNIDYDDNAEVELNLAKYQGNGNFFTPKHTREDAKFAFKMRDAEGEGFSAYQAVWAAQYKFSLGGGKSKTFTQVMTIQEDFHYNKEENEFESVYFDDAKYQQRVNNTRAFYDDLFSKRTIKTSNELYNNFINEFTPLQMFWVCSLDRGWPSSMRGIRDASQDFTGMTPINPEWTRQTILQMFSHQQVDGWMPRQINTFSRKLPHDMRYYCDGGAFLLELIHEYITYTRDISLLKETVYWLDSDEQSTILEHILRCTQFYLDEHNIGEHDLCKVWYGDWWDNMDEIGMEGRGESVTVTAQMILNLKNLANMFRWLYKNGEVDESYLEIADKYLKYRERFLSGMHKHAFNKDGYFNGYFNDDGKWLLSDKDPDGLKRMYLVSNAWAIIGKCTTPEMRKTILEHLDKMMKNKYGYYLMSDGYRTPIPKAGRVGNGTTPAASLYNHSQAFITRAFCECGEAELAYDATRHFFPIETFYAPVERTMAPPYAIANKYSASDKFPQRVTLQFLSGTVSYVLRITYNFFCGIKYDYDGLILKPCVPEAFGDFSVEFSYLGKKFTVNYIKSDYKSILLNGNILETEIDATTGKQKVFIADDEMADQNTIIVNY